VNAEPVNGARAWAAAVLTTATLALGACGSTIPADPDGTLDRIRREQVLRAGASPRAGWVVVRSPSQDPTGREVGLVEGFAASLGAEVAWIVSGEEDLVGRLEDGSLDVVVGGVTDQNPYSADVAMTRPYLEQEVRGTVETHVMFVPMGENALQSALERWLDEAVPR
jgi:hypothetical protein